MTANMETQGALAAALNVQMLLPNAYVIGISWNTLQVRVAILLVLMAVCVGVMFVAQKLAKTGSLTATFAMIENVQNVQITLTCSVWHLVVAILISPKVLAPARAKLAPLELTIKAYVCLAITTVLPVQLEH